MNTPEISALVIEDELIFSRLLENELSKSIQKIDVYQNTQDGFDHLKNHKPDLIFVDNFLPGKDGVDVLKDYKEISPNSKVILMSGALDIRAISEAIMKGADFLLNKKVDLSGSLKPILECEIKKTKAINSRPNENNDVIHIAVLEDEEIFSLHINWILNGLAKNTKITSFKNTMDFVESLVEREVYDYVFSDYYLVDNNIKSIMPMIKTKIPNSKIVVFSSKADVQQAIDLKNLGIDFFIEKDENWKVHFLNTLKEFNLF